MIPVDVLSDPWKKFQTMSPANRKIDEVGIPFFRTKPKTSQKIPSCISGETIDQRSPRTEFLYLTLMSVGQVDEQLARPPELAKRCATLDGAETTVVSRCSGGRPALGPAPCDVGHT